MLSNITSSDNLFEYSLGEGIGQNTENLKNIKEYSIKSAKPMKRVRYFIESVTIHPHKSSQAQNHITPTPKPQTAN